MKRFVVVGLGNFGSSVAESLFSQRHEVIAIDMNEESVDRVAAYVSRAAVGDAKNINTLERLGVKGADAAVVSTGDDITAIRDAGALKLEGKEYVVRDGDIMHFRFNV